jgi:hypothetical protein
VPIPLEVQSRSIQVSPRVVHAFHAVPAFEDPNHRLLRHVVRLLTVTCDQDERAKELAMLGLEERLEGRSTRHVRPFAGRSIDHAMMKHLARRVRDCQRRRFLELIRERADIRDQARIEPFYAPQEDEAP